MAVSMGYGVVGTMRKVLMSSLFCLCGFMATAEPVQIVALGDSLTQGYGLVPEQGFVPQLQNWLSGQGVEVEVINAGVSGDTTAGGAARIDWALTPEVDAMIVTLGGNDLLRGLDPAEARKNLTVILEAARAAEVPVLLIGMDAPSNYGPDYKQAFDAIYPDLSAQFGALYAEDFFAGLDADTPAQARAFMQPDGIHPNAEGVARIVAALGPQVAELAELAEDQGN
ncbi:arylesterase [Ruegeria discodermiae]|uniref:arylesterase n=1 Tax=Ruegeria discodermiae TaxID=3064389 RepID=UPI003532012D